MFAVVSQARRQADKIGGMRKLVATLLLSLITLQTSWAAVAGYCQHEQGVKAGHFGHHEHQHEAHKAAQPGATVADADCSLCQAGFLTALMIESGLSLVMLSVTGSAEPGRVRPPPAPLDLPERPNWS